MSGRRGLRYSLAMDLADDRMTSPCPDPLARAARAGADARGTREWLRLAPPTLHGALVALVGRDTREQALCDAQRLTHFPASTMVSISWFHDTDVGTVERAADGAGWSRFGAQVVVSGTQSSPVTTWAQGSGRGYIACFTADAARALFDLDLATLQDRFVPVDQVVGAHWRPLWDALLASDEADLMRVLERHLGARWQSLQGSPSTPASLRRLGQHWVERLALQAREWGRVHGLRHVERRIKSFSGRSLRERQALVRSEGLYFAARDRFDAGLPLAWAELADAQGFSDQAHMIRSTRRVTGFSPTEFAQRFVEDESFWMYRLWV